MKPILLLFCSLFCDRYCIGQEIYGAHDTIGLEISSYRPFISEGEFFVAYYKDAGMCDRLFDAFSAANGKLQGNRYYNETGLPFISFSNLKKGRYEVPSVVVEYRGNVYRSNKFIFEVVDTFTLSNSSLRILALFTSDSTASILIDQNIPVDSTGMSDEFQRMKRGFDMSKEAVALNGKSELISSCRFISSSSSSKVLKLGASSMGNYTYSNSVIINLSIPKEFCHVQLTEADFLNIPKDHKFEPIPIR